MNSGLTPSPSVVAAAPLGPVGVPGVKLKFCRYYAKDKTCFYGDECQFLHEDPLGIHGNSSVQLSLSGGGPTVYPTAVLPGPVNPGVGPVSKKVELGGHAGPGLDTQRLTIPGIDGSPLPDTSLTDSYFSTSFIGVNGFGSPAEGKYPMMQ